MAGIDITVDEALLPGLLSGDGTGVAQLMQSVLNQILSAQADDVAGAARYERSEGRQAYRMAKSELLQQTLRVWLVGRPDTTIGAYWPIKGEFDPLPALYRWQEDGVLNQAGKRRIGLPVVNKVHKTLTFHAWYPGCEMEEDAYGIPKPKDTDLLVPTVLLVPCVGYGPGGYRLGYGGGFYDRTLATLQPKPYTVGLGFAQGFVPDFAPQPHDIPLDTILTEQGVMFEVGR